MNSRNIKMKIRSLRYDVEESFFSEMEEDTPPVDLDVSDELGSFDEEDAIELSTEGVMNIDEKSVDLVYEESELTGMEGSTTTVHFDLENPGFVTIYRSGTVSTTLAFERGKRHHCAYNTPIMPFEICVRTIKVENDILRDGTLRLDYVIEIRGAKAERTKFELKVIDL